MEKLEVPCLLLAIIFLLFSPLRGFSMPCYQWQIGPECYYLHRIREGGSQQKGMIYGVNVQAERIKGKSWYAGLDYLYAKGDLQGKSRSNLSICSQLKDSIIEARLGYCLEGQFHRPCYFIPFGGYGYFHETNQFHSPSPVPFLFTDTFYYCVAGFLSSINFSALVSIGLNFKVYFMLNGKSQISKDPLFKDISLDMENEIQYRLEVPCFYHLCSFFKQLLSIGLIPFYEFRHFGGREDFPFNFIDTKFHLYGLKCFLKYKF